MKSARKNIVITPGTIRGCIWEYDFTDGKIRQGDTKGFKETYAGKNIRLRALCDITQTWSSRIANEVLEAVEKGKHYENIVEIEGQIHRVYEANVPSPFLKIK